VSIIQSTPVEEEIEIAILEGLEKLKSSVNYNQIRYAVRSSAIGEDSEETSAAGQNSTYLGVKDANDVVKSVAKCWASLFSHQSVEYR
jgi:pyruvate,water dikinase